MAKIICFFRLDFSSPGGKKIHFRIISVIIIRPWLPLSVRRLNGDAVGDAAAGDPWPGRGRHELVRQHAGAAAVAAAGVGDEEQVAALYLGPQRLPARVTVFLDFFVPRLRAFMASASNASAAGG